MKVSLFGLFGPRIVVGWITRKLKLLTSCILVFSVEFMLEGITSVATENKDADSPDDLVVEQSQATINQRYLHFWKYGHQKFDEILQDWFPKTSLAKRIFSVGTVIVGIKFLFGKKRRLKKNGLISENFTFWTFRTFRTSNSAEILFYRLSFCSAE